MTSLSETDLLIHTAIGKPYAFIRLLEQNIPALWRRLAVLQFFSNDLPPIVALAASAKIDNPPAKLQAWMDQSALAATLALIDPACAALHEAMRENPHALPLMLESIVDSEATNHAPQSRHVTDAVWSALASVDLTPIACIAAYNSLCAVHLMALVSRMGWHDVPQAVRQAILQSLIRTPRDAARAGGAFWRLLDHEERLMVANGVANDSFAVADLMRIIGAEGWSIAPSEARQALLNAVAHSPYEAMHGFGAIWTTLDSESLHMLARSVAQDAYCASLLLARIGGEAQMSAPETVRQLLLRAITRDPQSAARGGGTAWRRLTNEERWNIVRAVAPHPLYAAELTALIGAAEWSVASAEMQAMLFDSIVKDARAVVTSSAAWSGMSDDDRLRLAQIVIEPRDAAVDLITRIGADGWRDAPARARQTLFNVILHDPLAAAYGGSVIWFMIDADARAALMRVIAMKPAAAAILLERIGADGWRISPASARQMLFAAIMRNAKHAVRGGGAIWSDLEDSERQAIIALASRTAPNAAYLINRIGAVGIRSLNADDRDALMRAAFRSPLCALRVATELWRAMNEKERADVAFSIARNQSALCAWLEARGTEAWQALTEKDRASIIKNLKRDPFAVVIFGKRCANPDVAERTVCGNAIWSALRDDERMLLAEIAARDPNVAASLIAAFGGEGWDIAPIHVRETLFHAVSRSPDAAAQAFLAIEDRLEDDLRVALARAAIGGSAAVRAVTKALCDGEPWRDWMSVCLPREQDDDSLLDEWRHALTQMDDASALHAMTGMPVTIVSRLMPSCRRHTRMPT